MCQLALCSCLEVENTQLLSPYPSLRTVARHRRLYRLAALLSSEERLSAYVSTFLHTSGPSLYLPSYGTFSFDARFF